VEIPESIGPCIYCSTGCEVIRRIGGGNKFENFSIKFTGRRSGHKIIKVLDGSDIFTDQTAARPAAPY
jgi:hypothetical protein